MARRQAAKKGMQRSRLRHGLRTFARVALVAAVFAGVGALFDWVSDPATLPVESVRIRGTFEHVAHEALRASIEPFLAAGFVRLDMGAVRAAVEALPWVRRASVRRAWPATLMVQVEEQEAAAVWGSGGLLNRAGERFAGEGGPAASALPHLAGPDGAERTVMVRYQQMQGVLAALGLGITRLEMDARRAWRLQLASGLELQLGRQAVDARLLRFVRTFADAIAPRLKSIESVDLRYTNGFAVRWKTGMAPAQA